MNLKKKHTILITVFFTVVFSTAQKKSNSEMSSTLIPNEGIYIHLNTATLLAGEYAYYKIYCFNKKSKEFTNYSKVAYVELVGLNGEKVIKQKVILDLGKGYGDFFIPTSVSTGSYKLVAYTNLMRNFEERNFFQNDIYIINPYSVEEISLNNVRFSEEYHDNDSIAKYKVNSGLGENLDSENSLLTIRIKNKEIKKRSKVNLVLETDKKIIKGNLSISIRKKDNLKQPYNQNLIKFYSNLSNEETTLTNNTFLPEIRGEVISGILSSINGSSVANQKVALSIPNNNFYLAITTTNFDGKFNFKVNKPYNFNDLVFQVLDKNNNEYSVKLIDKKPIDYKKFNFIELVLNEELASDIIERSIHNQLDNSYFKYRTDSILPNKPMKLFMNWEKKIYKLDDYRRFKTIEETIFEYVKSVFIKRLDKDVKNIRIQGNNLDSNSGFQPLIILDGVLIKKHNDILSLNADDIDKIVVYRNEFIIGPQIYQGALVLNSKSKKGLSLINDRLRVISSNNYGSSARPKKYYKQSYDDSLKFENARIPDDRYQLLWEPNLEFNKDLEELVFYTSDITGEFEIYVEGIIQDSIPVSIKKSFKVTN